MVQEEQAEEEMKLQAVALDGYYSKKLQASANHEGGLAARERAMLHVWIPAPLF